MEKYEKYTINLIKYIHLRSERMQFLLKNNSVRFRIVYIWDKSSSYK